MSVKVRLVQLTIRGGWKKHPRMEVSLYKKAESNHDFNQECSRLFFFAKDMAIIS